MKLKDMTSFHSSLVYFEHVGASWHCFGAWCLLALAAGVEPGQNITKPEVEVSNVKVV
jgi:hypothetical protein